MKVAKVGIEGGLKENWADIFSGGGGGGGGRGSRGSGHIG